VTFGAPTVSIRPGFRVYSGAQFRAQTGPVTCVTTTTLQRDANASTTAAPRQSDQQTESLGGIVHYPHASRLPAWVKALLKAHGVDLDAMGHSVLDEEGQWLVFETGQDLGITDTNRVSDIYRLDLIAETLALLSRTPDGHAGNGPSSYPAVDWMGQWVLFQSDASDLAEGDANGVTDIVLAETWTGTVENLTQTAERPSAHPAVDAWGEQVVFDRLDEAGYRQILGGETWGIDATSTLSLPMNGAGLSLDNHHPGLSPDGRFVVYLESAVDTEQAACAVHFYDWHQDRDASMPCPAALANHREQAMPQFGADGATVLWSIRNEKDVIPVGNPFFDENVTDAK
jgi:hypothetical protein